MLQHLKLFPNNNLIKFLSVDRHLLRVKEDGCGKIAGCEHCFHVAVIKAALINISVLTLDQMITHIVKEVTRSDELRERIITQLCSIQRVFSVF